MKYIYISLAIIFGLVGGITFILSFVEFTRDGLAGLYLLLFSIVYLVATGIFVWLGIKRIRRSKTQG